MRNGVRFLAAVIAIALAGDAVGQGQRMAGQQAVGAYPADSDPKNSSGPLAQIGGYRGNLNDVRVTTATPGADICAKIATAIAGLPGTGGTIDATYFTGTQPCASNPLAKVSVPVVVQLGQTIIQSSVQWVVATDKVRLLGAGKGQTFLTYTGSAAVASVIKFGTAQPTVQQGMLFLVSLENMSIYGNAKVTDGVLIVGTHHSLFARLDIKNVTGACFHTQFSVMPTLDDIECSINTGLFTTTPTNGLLLDQISADYPTTDGTVNVPKIEGVSGSGIKLTGAFGMTFLTGTSEQSGRGIEITSAGTNNRNTFIGIDLESNSIEDVLDNGTYNSYINILALSQFHLGSTSINAMVRGGQFGNIQVDSGASFASFESLIYNLGGSQTVSDSGTGTRWKNLVNAKSPSAIQPVDGGWTFRDTVPNIGISNIASPVDQQDMLRGTFNVGAAPTVISKTPMGGSVWRVLFLGGWMDSIDGSGLKMPAFLSECTAASPSILVGSVSVTCGKNGSNQLTLTASSGTVAFTGTMFVATNTVGVPGTTSAAFAGTVQGSEILTGSAGLSINGGTALTGQTGTGANVVTSTSPSIDGTSQYGRLRASQGTPLSASDFSLAPGWGNHASVNVLGGTDAAFVLVVSSAGTGQTTNPGVTLTYHDGSYGGGGTVPVCTRGDMNNPVAATWSATNTSSASLTLVFIGTPFAGTKYQVNCAVLGR